MSSIVQEVGKAIVVWQSKDPLKWSMQDAVVNSGDSRNSFQADWTLLRAGYSETFLLELKQTVMARRLRVALVTVATEEDRIRRYLEICQRHYAKARQNASLPNSPFSRIDSDFMMGVAAIKDEVPLKYRQSIRAVFLRNRQNAALFAPDLTPGDFSTDVCNGMGMLARLRQNVLAQALTRSALVDFLNVTEAAFDAGTLDLGRYAFSRLLLSRSARPKTYRLIRCKDLRIDDKEGSKAYFLTLRIPKTRLEKAPEAVVSINREVGQLLELQREAVVRRLSHIVDENNAERERLGGEGALHSIGDLPLFPPPGRIFRVTKARMGVIPDAASFDGLYVEPLRKLARRKITCTAMRHTIGTQLAIAGCSSNTIAAVLLHARDDTARVYVDLAFDGAIDALSDSMEDAFLQHFPVFKDFVSVDDRIAPEKQIRSESSDRTRREITGECGRTNICHYAPLSCYECHRFRPCYDVDHSINLDVVSEELREAKEGGLQRQVDVKRYMHIANRIRVVIQLCELKRHSVSNELQKTQATA